MHERPTRPRLVQRSVPVWPSARTVPRTRLATLRPCSSPTACPPPPSPPSQLRILEAQPRAPSGRSLRQVSAGWLQQGADSLQPSGIEFTCVSEVQPTPQQLEDLKFAW